MSEETPAVVEETPAVVEETPAKFIGSSKLIKSEPQGNDFVHYETEDGRSGLVKLDQLDNMARVVAYDDQYILVYKWQPASSKVLQVLLDYDLPMSDLGFVSKQVQQSVIDNYEKAVSKFFKRQITEHVRLSQIDEVLKTDTEFIKE